MTIGCGRLCSAALVLAAVVCGTAISAQEPTLTPHALDEAIRWGESGEASPYLLHHAQTATTTSDVVVGAVYTPFVRVALAAKAAWDAGQRLQRDAVPDALLEPVVYIAFRWYCCDGDHGDQWSYHPMEPFDYQIAVPGNPRELQNVMARPLWVRRDLAVLGALGGPPYPDVVLVAAYPLSALSQPGDFVIFRSLPNPASPMHPSTYAEVGRMTVADMRAWR